LSIVQADATTYHVAIASLEDQASGTATITVTVTDGSFTYSDVFAVTTLGTVPQIEWVDMELVCTPAVSYQWHLDGAAIAGATGQTWTPQENGLYTVETVDADGCAMTSEAHLFTSTGVGLAADRSGLRAYPVPVRGLLMVEGSQAGAHITVIDAQGRAVANATAQGERTLLDLGDLAPGRYVLRIAGHGHDQRMPVVVE
ncbi:MAG: T9SS type A sorting domain-containing protein, partial [Flavobacteriales bacterium]|nr:T9SS type A sorting domain-containing protein [Flavobacteriales bacterium]